MTFGILALGFPVSEVLQVLQPLGAHSLTFFPILPYLNAFLRWRLASWPWGSLFRRFWRVLQPLGAHSLTFFPILPYLNAFLRWRLASWPWGSLFRRFCRFCSLWGLTVSLSSLFFPILLHSLGDVWHPGPGVPCFGGFAGFAAFGGSPLGAHSLTFFPILPYLTAFLRWRLASWPWGSLFRRFWRVLQPLGAHSLTFFPILPYLNAFLRWRLASWPWGSLFRSFCRFCSLWGLTVSLSSLFFPILMHSLGDVWHPGPGVPCFGGFAGFAAFGGSPLGAHSLTFFPILPYLNAFLRWRLASWPWGSLFRRFWRVLQPLGAHSLTFFPILPYLNAFLRWRLASCFGGFAAFGGSQSHFLPYSSLS